MNTENSMIKPVSHILDNNKFKCTSRDEWNTLGIDTNWPLIDEAPGD